MLLQGPLDCRRVPHPSYVRRFESLGYRLLQCTLLWTLDRHTCLAISYSRPIFPRPSMSSLILEELSCFGREGKGREGFREFWQRFHSDHRSELCTWTALFFRKTCNARIGAVHIRRTISARCPEKIATLRHRRPFLHP
jgi:hypothetical protein